MGVYLLDVNVLMPLAWGSHSQRRAAVDWFDALGGDQWATCPMTQCSLVRLSLNPKAVGQVMPPRDVFRLLDNLVSHSKHVFWEDSIGLASSPHIARSAIQGHLQIADAYLLGLCLARGGRLATFDRGLLSLARTAEERAAIELIPT